MKELVKQLKKEFKDKAYRHAYAEETLNSFIATQIKVLREQRGWTQEELAKYSGMKQERISAIENVNYSSWSLKTLKKLTVAFDLTLRVSYEGFGDFVTGVGSFSREYLERPSFDGDSFFKERLRRITADSTKVNVIIAHQNATREFEDQTKVIKLGRPAVNEEQTPTPISSGNNLFSKNIKKTGTSFDKGIEKFLVGQKFKKASSDK